MKIKSVLSVLLTISIMILPFVAMSTPASAAKDVAIKGILLNVSPTEIYQTQTSRYWVYGQLLTGEKIRITNLAKIVLSNNSVVTASNGYFTPIGTGTVDVYASYGGYRTPITTITVKYQRNINGLYTFGNLGRTNYDFSFKIKNNGANIVMWDTLSSKYRDGFVGGMITTGDSFYCTGIRGQWANKTIRKGTFEGMFDEVGNISGVLEITYKDMIYDPITKKFVTTTVVCTYDAEGIKQ